MLHQDLRADTALKELLEQGVKDAKIDDTDSISSLSDIRDDEENPLLPNGKVPKVTDSFLVFA